MFVFKAAVVGAGTMGGEIAHVIANADIPVVLKDVDQRFVDQGLDKARSLWQARVDAGKLDAEALQSKLGLITGATGYESFGDVDFVIEAVPERIEIKQTVFAELDEVTPGHAILASNTSSLSITEMALATSRPDKVVGFHFFYPGVGDAADRGDRGRGHLARDRPGRGQLRPGDPEDRDPLWRGAGLRGQPDPELERLGAVALPGGDRDRRQGARQDRRRSPRPRRSARSSWATCSGSTPSCTSPSTCATRTAIASTCTSGCASSCPRAQARREDRGGLL